MFEVKQLTKTFALSKKGSNDDIKNDPRYDNKSFHAVKNIDFSIQQGEIIALLGQNGAGKTTLLRLLSSALEPSNGTISYNGNPLSQQSLELRRHIGFLSGNTGLYGRLTAREMVAYFGKLHGLNKSELNQQIDSLFERLDMESFANKRCDSLSAGMKQKVSIARTLVHDPDIIIFDEPTTGLDVAAADGILRLLERLS